MRRRRGAARDGGGHGDVQLARDLAPDEARKMLRALASLSLRSAAPRLAAPAAAASRLAAPAPPLVQQSRSMCRAHMQWFQPTLRAMAAPYFARSNKGEFLDPMTKTTREKGGVVVFRDSRRRRRVQKKRQQIITTHARRQVGHKRAAAFAKVVQKERKERVKAVWDDYYEEVRQKALAAREEGGTPPSPFVLSKN